MNYQFAYLVGALLFDAAWLACYLIGKRYRPQIIWGTVVITPPGLASFLFVPQYWTPPSLFNLDAHTRRHACSNDDGLPANTRGHNEPPSDSLRSVIGVEMPPA